MSYLLLKTIDMNACLKLVDEIGHVVVVDEWEAGRSLAKDLLAHIDQLLEKGSISFHDIKGIGVHKGPGSFTSLRIGLTTMNTIAFAENIPIVGVGTDAWEDEAVMRLSSGDNDESVMPEYGADPHITAPRK